VTDVPPQDPPAEEGEVKSDFVTPREDQGVTDAPAEPTEPVEPTPEPAPQPTE
jgi:hypothetical protein